MRSLILTNTGVPPRKLLRLAKEDLRAMYRFGINLVERFRFTPGNLASWAGRILILESDEDLLTPEQRAELR